MLRILFVLLFLVAGPAFAGEPCGAGGDVTKCQLQIMTNTLGSATATIANLQAQLSIVTQELAAKAPPDPEKK